MLVGYKKYNPIQFNFKTIIIFSNFYHILFNLLIRFYFRFFDFIVIESEFILYNTNNKVMQETDIISRLDRIENALSRLDQIENTIIELKNDFKK